ncbi:shikimate dehydrogenase [Bosea minatitlanensis]|jgi:shikimate dehydrogenase|uniref:shikimate dehydrogenase n=1 Tax=Bosea minatitlanensis TaxID=128782 RepID=UPI0021A84C4B|nr:shikimate dehydrogenase [Bosea minatitlanensis]MCT4493961.1 shikimate dehydrogenase [Bosea minatitlanensis]
MPSSKPAVLIGLIGADIQQSLAPEIHMREGEQQGLRYFYRLIDIARLGLDETALPELLLGAERCGFDGLGITHPCKQLVISHLTELSEAAQALGSANTVLFRDGKRIGHNTDWVGFAEMFRRDMGGQPRANVVQLGAGGAGVAVAFAALTVGVQNLTIFDVDAGKADRVVDTLTRHFGEGRIRRGDDLEAAVASAEGLVNATPVGMDAHPGMPLPERFLRSDLWVIDIIYFPRETELLRKARALGAKALNGGTMTVLQAAGQFRLFANVEPDIERMLSDFEQIAAR